MAPTPDNDKEKAKSIRQFGEDWEFRATTKEIARKNKAWYLDIWPRQHQVKIMYLWIKINWSQFANRNLPFPIDHNNAPKGPGQPVLYALLGGWTIPKNDLNYLMEGPLYSENWELLVPEKTSQWRTLFLKSRKVILWISVAVGIVWSAYWLFNNQP